MMNTRRNITAGCIVLKKLFFPTSLEIFFFFCASAMGTVNRLCGEIDIENRLGAYSERRAAFESVRDVPGGLLG